MKTLEISLQTVTHIAELRKEIREKYKEQEDDSGASSPNKLMEFLSDPLRAEIHELINAMSLNQKRELSALVWLGRKNFSNFENAFEHAKTVTDEHTASYLEGKALDKLIPDGITVLINEDILLSD